MYEILAVQPVDMFPHTHHVENVVKLRGGEKILVNYLPKGTKFTITEETVSHFHTSYSVGGDQATEGHTATGSLETDVTVIFRNATSAMLPETGSTGIFLYALPLGLAFAFALMLPVVNHFREKRNKAA